MAESIVDLVDEGAARTARALVVLGRHQDAAEVVAAELRVSRRSQRWQLASLLDDIRLADPTSLARVGGNAHRPSPVLSALYGGRPIAIVGPTKTDEDWMHRLSGYEVVVAPKLSRETATQLRTAGVDTVVSYFTDVSESLLSNDIISALDDGLYDQVVVRPLVGPPIGSELRRHPRVVCATGEPALHLEASSYALQRIAYDVIAHHPSSVMMLNADLFTTGRYDAGYREDAQRAARRRILLNLAGYGHDLVSDRRLLAALVGKSVLACDERLQSILSLDDRAYLRTVERNNGTRSPG